MLRIAIITTVNHNVGDDFVREGIVHLLRAHFGYKNLKIEHIHKHSPITNRYGFEWFRNFIYSRKVDEILPLWLTKGRVETCDLLVQSGAPVYWCHNSVNSHCHDNEWYKPLIKRRFTIKSNTQLINLAAGSCQRYDSDGSEFCKKCNSFIKELFDQCEVTTVRDTLAATIMGHIGIKAPVIPCSSIFAIDEHKIKSQPGEYVVVNYMKGGAHYTFGQAINAERWEDEFRTFYFKLKKTERVVFSCHNKQEQVEALVIDPEAEIFFEEHDYLAFMQFYAKAKYGIMNRVHGAFLMASLGKPSLIVGNDSRARMASEIGLESVFVNDADADMLASQCQYLASGANGFVDRFALIKEKAKRDYLAELAKLR